MNELVTFAIIAFFCLGAMYVLHARLAGWCTLGLFMAAGLARIVGSIARFEVMDSVYGHVGDAHRYYLAGLSILAEHGSGYVFLTQDFWTSGGRWWSTQFIERLSAVVLSIIGESMRGEFLVFSFLAFGGLYAIAKAFWNVQPGPQARVFAAAIWLWPSLWFWSSSIGKEAVLTLAVGLSVLGYAGRNGQFRWVPYLAGVGLAVCIRPHVGAAIVGATVAATWLAAWSGLTVRRVAEGAMGLVILTLVVRLMASQFGLADADLEGWREFVEFQSDQTLQGGSNIGSAPLSGGNPFEAVFNVLARPFIWESDSSVAMAAGLEVVAFWSLVVTRRREVLFALLNFRKHRLLRFAVPFVVGYALMIGLTFGNMGIIARQRSLIIPFLFMIVLAAPPRRTHHVGATGGTVARVTA